LDHVTTASPSRLIESLIEITVESWRFSRLFSRALRQLDAGEAGRYSNQQRYYLKRLEEHLGSFGFRIVNLEGQPYDPGMAATALNITDFGRDDGLMVDQMIEPIIMGDAGLVKTGAIMVRKIEQ
jgi:hypothetical protein